MALAKRGLRVGSVDCGCLPSLLQLIGTRFQPDFRERILFIENPDGEQIDKGAPISVIHSQISDLNLAGVFDEIAGLVVGRPFGYTEIERIEFEEVVRSQIADYSCPVIFNAVFGHTDPILTLPLGLKSTLHSRSKLWSIDEPGVS